MSADIWKSIVALAFGSAIGVGIRRSLALLFGQSERSVSVSTVTASSILGVFSGAAIGYIMASRDLSKELQSILTFGLLGMMATVAADATAAQASLNAQDAARVRKRLGAHIAIGAGAALISIGIVTWIVDVFS
jgi:fluoride ion exporter CrcB/FEX